MLRLRDPRRDLPEVYTLDANGIVYGDDAIVPEGLEDKGEKTRSRVRKQRSMWFPPER